jgi:hypothetical protein
MNSVLKHCEAARPANACTLFRREGDECIFLRFLNNEFDYQGHFGHFRGPVSIVRGPI